MDNFFDQEWENEMLLFKMRMQNLDCEMQGMIAANKRTELCGGNLPQFGYEDFMKLPDKHHVHENSFPSYKGRG